MKKLIAILPLLMAAAIAFAQDGDFIMTVRKKGHITIVPDIMYLESGYASTFTIRGIPAGCKATGDFGGYELFVKDSIFTIRPVDYELVSGKYPGTASYVALHIKISDHYGNLKDFLDRKCYVKPAGDRITVISAKDTTGRQQIRFLR